MIINIDVGEDILTKWLFTQHVISNSNKIRFNVEVKSALKEQQLRCYGHACHAQPKKVHKPAAIMQEKIQGHRTLMSLLINRFRLPVN